MEGGGGGGGEKSREQKERNQGKRNEKKLYTFEGGLFGRHHPSGFLHMEVPALLGANGAQNYHSYTLYRDLYI